MTDNFINKVNSNYTIKIIDSKETYAVRHPILRAGKPLESCVFDGDDFETTIHLGLFTHNKLIGISSFLEKKHISFNETTQYQLRGMAILKEFQGKSLGNIILKEGELILKKKGVKVIWCNAREVAVKFYMRNNYEIIGDAFNIKNIGLHYTMYKVL